MFEKLNDINEGEVRFVNLVRIKKKKKGIELYDERSGIKKDYRQVPRNSTKTRSRNRASRHLD